MTSKYLFKNSIHLRFLAVALLPLLLITFALSLYTIDARKSDLTVNLNTSGEMASNYLATVSDFALYSRNLSLLATTAETVVRIPDVTSVAYIDQNHELIFSSENFPKIALPSFASPQATQQHAFLFFKKPIYLSGIEFTDYSEEASDLAQETELIGWVIVVVDQSLLLGKQQDIITTSLWLSAAGVSIAIILTYLLSLMLIAPIRQLTTTIKKMASGDLDVRAQTGTKDELSILASGINQLAKSVTEGKTNLEDRIRVATHQLQETLADLKKNNLELETAREDAEAADQVKSDFLARMSHELRTPITSIQGFIRLLESSNLPESDRRYCQIIDHAAFQLLTLIDDILAFSKLQSDTVVLALQPIDLAECAEQVAALFALQAQHKGLELIIDYEPELPLHRIGDSVRIQQILSNLIANAIKFCDEGGVYIYLKTNENQEVVFEIQDTGIGILNEAQDQLFNAFAQADTSISRLYGGTGLGLSIVKNLVDLMKGKIDLRSTVGKGSCFQISIPLPLCGTQPNWQVEQAKVMLAGCNKLMENAVVHSLKRFGIRDITVTEREDLLKIATTLSSNDRIILCPPAQSHKRPNIAEFMLEVRTKTSAKLILIAPQFNFYQQFNAKERAALQPITFLASPPPLSELHSAIKQQTSNQTSTTATILDIQVLDGINILIAEDNQFTRLLLDTLLSKLGAYCTLTSNGNEALAACQHDHFDLFLVDIHMPKKNGIETVRALRQSNNFNAEIPTLAMTADILQQEKKSLFEAGANGLLIKPLDEQELLEKICLQLNISPPQEPVLTTDTSHDVSVEIFRQEVCDLLGSARENLDSNCIAELRENIHQLLGIAGVFKLALLETQVKKLHEQVKTNNLDDVKELINEIETGINTIDL